MDLLVEICLTFQGEAWTLSAMKCKYVVLLLLPGVRSRCSCLAGRSSYLGDFLFYHFFFGVHFSGFSFQREWFYGVLRVRVAIQIILLLLGFLVIKSEVQVWPRPFQLCIQSFASKVVPFTSGANSLYYHTCLGYGIRSTTYIYLNNISIYG